MDVIEFVRYQGIVFDEYLMCEISLKPVLINFGRWSHILPSLEMRAADDFGSTELEKKKEVDLVARSVH